MIKAYTFSEEYLSKELEKYNDFGKVDFTFQEFVESFSGPTRYCKEFFIKNNLHFDEKLSETVTRKMNDKIFYLVIDTLSKSACGINK